MIPHFAGIRGKSEQAETDIGHLAAQPRQARGLPHQVPHRPLRGRAVQRREGLSHQADQGAQARQGVIEQMNEELHS